MKKVPSKKKTVHKNKKQKRLHWNQLKVPPRQRFRAAAPVLEDVGRCGEDMTAALLGGKVISNRANLEVTLDVFEESKGVGVEAKMANRTHRHRPVVGQIARLYENVLDADDWLKYVKTGVYSLIFYDGVGETKGKRGCKAKRKSKIMSPKMSRERRRAILAKELQFIYLVDVALMNYLGVQPEFKHLRELMSHAAFVDSDKLYRQDYTMLCLTRTFLKGFMAGEEMDELHKHALEKTYGEDGWVVEERVVKMRFKHKDGHSFVKEVPIRKIGSKKTVKVLRGLITRKEEFSMSLKAPLRRKLVNN